MDNYSRDSIKRRMIGRIATLWDIEDIQNVDPIVRLMIESVSEEIFRLAGEMDNLDDRLLAKLAASLSPVEYITPRPCHALMESRAYEESVRIDSNTVFSYDESKIVRKYDLEKIDFIPISPFTVIDGSISYLSIATKMYKAAGGFRKSLCAVAQYGDKSLSNSVWIGLNVGTSVGRIKDFSLYLDFVDLKDKYQYLNLLSLCKCYVGGIEIPTRSGLPEAEDQAPYLRHPLTSVLSDIRRFYKKHYITLSEIDTTTVMTFPKELETYYSVEEIQQYTEPLLWIKVEFADAISEEVLEQLRIAINCFPIANISQRRVSQQMGDITLFMPLDTPVNEFFVAMKTVCDSAGKVYHPLDKDSYMSGDRNHRTYTLRKGGVEQYSTTNDTISTVSRLVDILKDRNLFNNTRIAKEFSETMSEAMEITNKLSQMLDNVTTENQLKSYLLVDKSNSREMLIADYYTTNGAVIADLKLVNGITSNISAQIQEEFSVMVTSAQGGYNDPSTERIKDIHRYMLTSSDRIFTKQDIRNCVYAHFTEQVEGVEVRNGVMVSNKPSEGMVSTIDVFLTLSSSFTQHRDKETFKSELYSLLANRSPESFHYRIIIE
ncbi:MAG: hypothetical protein RSF40_12125 [Oscillospiraceae bacterium]